MTPVVTAVPGTESDVSAAVRDPDQQLSALRALCALLEQTADALKAGDARVLSEIGPSLASTADGLRSLWLEVGIGGLRHDMEAERRRLLTSIAERRRFSKSMLRRWRRFILLRRQILGLESNRVSYGEWLKASGS